MVRSARQIDSSPRSARLPLLLALTFVVALVPVDLFGQTGKRISIYYTVSQTDPAPEKRERLQAFLKENYSAGKFVFIQGYGCDLGGFDRSLTIARRRGARANGLVRESGVPNQAIFSAGPIVHYGQPRKPHRRVVFAVFETEAEGRAALNAANGRARRINDETRKQLEVDEAEAQAALERAREQREQAAASANTGTEPADDSFGKVDPGDRSNDGWPAWLCWLLWILLFLLILLLLLWLLYYLWKRYQRNRERESHQLSREEAESLEVLTGGSVQPVAAVAPEPKPPSVAKKLSRRLPMAKKKAKKTITPLNIRGAVDKEFEGQTLNQIRKAPIHALEGLTPRHAMLLKEGFGIDTIEDLAKLKYFEIAKAITVLAKYEK